jgi:hypothetical protein
MSDVGSERSIISESAVYGLMNAGSGCFRGVYYVAMSSTNLNALYKVIGQRRARLVLADIHAQKAPPIPPRLVRSVAQPRVQARPDDLKPVAAISLAIIVGAWPNRIVRCNTATPWPLLSSNQRVDIPVKAVSVDHSRIFDQSEHPRLGVPGLRLGGGSVNGSSHWPTMSHYCGNTLHDWLRLG